MELVDVVAASSRTAEGLDEVEERDDVKVVGGGHSEFDALVTQPGCTSTSAVDIANHVESTADLPLQETLM